VPRALLIALLLLACPSFAADAAVSLEVPAGQSKSVRLRNLPSGTVLQWRSSPAPAAGRAGEREAAQIARRQPEPVFRGALDRSLSFKVVVPETSDYFLVLKQRARQRDAVGPDRDPRRAAAQRKPAPAPREKMQGA